MKNIDLSIDDKDQALLLPSSLRKSYANFKDTLLYGRKSLTLDKVQAALNFKKLNHQSEENSSSMAEGLNVRGRAEKRDFNPRSKSRSKSKVKIKRYHCHKEGHIRRLCLERQKGNQERKKEQAEVAVASDGYESADVLMVSNVNCEKEWI